MAEDRHKYKPIRVRPRESDRLWLLEHSAATGRAVNAIVSDAISAYRASLSGPTASGPTTSTVPAESGPTTEPKEPSGPTSGPTTEKRKSQRARAQEPAPPVAGLVPASSLPKPRRCNHPGKRSVGGWCPDCQHRILVGGEWA
jgi:hypothetical protein